MKHVYIRRYGGDISTFVSDFRRNEHTAHFHFYFPGYVLLTMFIESVWRKDFCIWSSRDPGLLSELETGSMSRNK